jgi:putative ABC transport system ATP-binding protein
MDLVRVLLDALVAGLPYAFIFLGIWLIFRLLDDFDLTVEGAFTLGAAVCVTLITRGWNPVTATVLASLSGAAAGLVTAVVHLRLKVMLLLSGIVTMIALYSINLRIMKMPNISLIGQKTIFSWADSNNAIESDLRSVLLLVALIFAVAGALGLFLKTDLGLGLRAAGANPHMARASGINTGLCVLGFLIISNSLAGLSGAVAAQQQNFADINMGIGVIIIGIAAILLGEIFFRRTGSVWFGIIGVLFGTVIYYVAVGLAVRAGLQPTDLKAFTSVILLVGIVVSFGIGRLERGVRTHRTSRLHAMAAELAPKPPLNSLRSTDTADEAKECRPLHGVARASVERTRPVREGGALALESVQVVYNAGLPNETEALRGVDLELNRGDFLTIIGSNGAGKSTLVSVIAGAVAPTKGRVALNGVDVTQEPEHRRARRVARVFQDPLAGTCPEFTISENLALAARRGTRRGLSIAVTPRRRKQFAEYLAQFGLGLEDRLSTRAGALSGGQRQALSIIMAVLQTPDLLMLDEHTAALDPRNQVLLLEMTKDLVRESGCTTIMVTHNMEHAIGYGDRMIMLHRGKVLLRFDDAQKRGLTVPGLVTLFHNADDAVLSDEMLMA